MKSQYELIEKNFTTVKLKQALDFTSQNMKLKELIAQMEKTIQDAKMDVQRQSILLAQYKQNMDQFH